MHHNDERVDQQDMNVSIITNIIVGGAPIQSSAASELQQIFSWTLRKIGSIHHGHLDIILHDGEDEDDAQGGGSVQCSDPINRVSRSEACFVFHSGKRNNSNLTTVTLGGGRAARGGFRRWGGMFRSNFFISVESWGDVTMNICSSYGALFRVP